MAMTAQDENSKTQRRKRARKAMGPRKSRKRKGGGLNSHWGGIVNPKVAQTDPEYPTGLPK